MEDNIKLIKNNLQIGTLLKWTGDKVHSNGKVFSPFKTEKTPSCHIYFKTNTFYDYSTTEQGDVIDYWMAKYGVDKKTAIAELLDKLGFSPALPGYNKSRVFQRDTSIVYSKKRFIDAVKEALPLNMSEREQYIFYERLGMCCSVDNNEVITMSPEVENWLKRTVEQCLKPVRTERLAMNKAVFEEMHRYCLQKGFDDTAYKYLTQVRKLPETLIKRFKIFTINNYFELSNHLKNKFDVEDLHRSGLFNKKWSDKKQGWSYNLIFYNHRIIIPYIFKKQIVYLRARYFDQDGNFEPAKDERSVGKYIGLYDDALKLNSPKRFYNSDVLFEMLDGENVYIVEGELDCMVVEDVFKKNCIAVPGVSNLKDERLELLKNYEVFVCVDNDTAGNMLYERIRAKFNTIRKPFNAVILAAKDANALLMN